MNARLVMRIATKNPRSQKTRLTLLMIVSYSLSSVSAYARPPCDDTAPMSFDATSMTDITTSLAQPHASVVEFGKRLKTLQAPACQAKLWPGSKASLTPVRVVDPTTKAVFQFNSKTGKFEYLRAMEDADSTPYIFAKPPTMENGDGGITVNIADKLPREKKPPQQQQQQQIPEDKKPACFKDHEDWQSHIQKYVYHSGGPDSVDKITQFTIHENIHNVDQDPQNPLRKNDPTFSWKGAADPDRNVSGDVKDIEYKRQNIISALNKAVTTKSSQEKSDALQQVRAWASALEKSHPGAMQELLDVDRAEGTAEYTGFMGNVLGKYGCNPTQDQIQSEMQKFVIDRSMPINQPVDTQAYAMGAEVGYLLDQMKVPDWKDQVAGGRTPLEVLLNKLNTPNHNKTPPTPVEDPILKAGYPIDLKLYNCQQKFAKETFSNIKGHPDDYVLVEMPKKAFNTSMFAQLQDGSSKITISPTASFIGDKSEFSFTGATVMKISNLCGRSEATNFVAIPRSAIGADGTLSSPNNQFIGKVPSPSSSTAKWDQVPVVCK